MWYNTIWFSIGQSYTRECVIHKSLWVLLLFMGHSNFHNNRIRLLVLVRSSCEKLTIAWLPCFRKYHIRILNALASIRLSDGKSNCVMIKKLLSHQCIAHTNLINNFITESPKCVAWATIYYSGPNLVLYPRS
jgi:hypothetical protein